MDTIEERAFKTYPIVKRLLPSGMLLDINSSRRIGYIKACEEYESLPKIHGWVARDGEENNNTLWFHYRRPHFTTDNEPNWWASDDRAFQIFEDSLFKDVTFGNSPVEVELLIRKV